MSQYSSRYCLLCNIKVLVYSRTISLDLYYTILHLYYNWNPLINYLKNKSKEFVFITKENLIAISITTVFIIGTLGVIQPFNSVYSFQKDIKEYWGDELGRPPYGHAELTSFKKCLTCT